MTTLTVYVLGDVPTFRAVLNGVAMVFQSALFNPTQGGSAFVVGSLISLVMVMFASVFSMVGGGGRGNFNPSIIIIAFLVYVIGIQQVARVQVEDIYTGDVTAVDNIPLIVALPASIFGTITMEATTAIETGMSTINGNYISVSAAGFTNPLKLLMSLRDGASNLQASGTILTPFLTASLKQYVLSCAIPAPDFNITAMNTAPDIIAYLTGLNVSGITTWYDNANPSGVGDYCADVATKLTTAQNNLFSSPADLNAIINSSMPTRPPSTSSTAWNTSDVAQSLGAIASPLALAQTAQQSMTNMLFMDTVNNTFSCQGSATTASDLNTCMQGLMQRDALEKWKVDASGGASVFTRTIIPSMNMMLILFYGFSPLILAIFFMSGTHGFKVLMGYLLFGAWTQSWLPFAAVINFYIEQSTNDKLQQLSYASPNGLTIAIYGPFYDAVSTSVALGSDMLAATPMISFALISGSMFALTNLAGRGGKDYVDEGQAAPSLLKNDAVNHNSSQHVGETMSSTNFNTGATDKTGFTPASISLGAITSGALSNAMQHTQQDGVNLSKSLLETATTSKGLQTVTTALASVGRDVAKQHNEVSTMADTIGDSVTRGKSLTTDENLAVKGQIALMAGAGAAPEKIVESAENLTKKFQMAKVAKSANAIAQLSFDGGVSAKDSIADQQQHAASLSLATQESNALSQSARSSFTRSIADSSSFSKVKSLSESAGRSANALVTDSNTATSLSTAQRNIGIDTKRDMGSVVKDVSNNATASLLATNALQGASPEQVDSAMARLGMDKADYGNLSPVAKGTALLLAGDDKGKAELIASTYGGFSSEAPGQAQLDQSVQSGMRKVKTEVEGQATTGAAHAANVNDARGGAEGFVFNGQNIAPGTQPVSPKHHVQHRPVSHTPPTNGGGNTGGTEDPLAKYQSPPQRKILNKSLLGNPTSADNAGHVKAGTPSKDDFQAKYNKKLAAQNAAADAQRKADGGTVGGAMLKNAGKIATNAAVDAAGVGVVVGSIAAGVKKHAEHKLEEKVAAQVGEDVTKQVATAAGVPATEAAATAMMAGRAVNFGAGAMGTIAFGADAYHHYSQGDYLGAGADTMGAVAVAPLVPPPVRVGAAVLGVGLYAADHPEAVKTALDMATTEKVSLMGTNEDLNKMLDKQREENGNGPTIKVGGFTFPNLPRDSN